MRDPIQTAEDVLNMIEIIKQQTLNGEVKSMVVITENTNGTMSYQTTATENVFALMGFILSVGLQRMGFKPDVSSREASIIGPSKATLQ